MKESIEVVVVIICLLIYLLNISAGFKNTATHTHIHTQAGSLLITVDLYRVCLLSGLSCLSCRAPEAAWMVLPEAAQLEQTWSDLIDQIGQSVRVPMNKREVEAAD